MHVKPQAQARPRQRPCIIDDRIEWSTHPRTKIKVIKCTSNQDNLCRAVGRFDWRLL